jgi:hypothetical protein
MSQNAAVVSLGLDQGNGGREGMGLDVSPDVEQSHAGLDRRTLEPALPNVPARAVVLVVSRGVRVQSALDGPADRLPLRAEQQMEVMAQQAIAVQFEGLARLHIGQCLQSGLQIGRHVKHFLAIVATIDDVVD